MIAGGGRRRAARVRFAALVAALLAVLSVGATACGRDDAEPEPITVFAAASLTESFTELGRRFEAANPGTEVRFSFGPSSGLATQITAGAPADVFASASEQTMRRVVDAGLASSPTVFATNTLQIAVPATNPATIDSIDDLADAGVKVVLCQEQVPCGTAADRTLHRAGLTVTPVSRETDVKAVLTKVSLNEADAGLVYVTDVRAAGDGIRGIEIPADLNTSTDYPIAVIDHAADESGDTVPQDAASQDTARRATARAFVDFVLSGTGETVLRQAGFGTR